MNKYELLSPAGDLKSAYAAINAGCNALYLGGIKYSARAYATNFTEEELMELISYAHLFNIKIYMAINTLFKNDELKGVCDYIKPYYEKGLDGVIMQDYGAIALVSKTFKDLEIHGSTQLTVTTADEVNFLASLGITRVVLARELSLAEIKEISEKTSIELEAFIHGALCYSYSGRCLMSSMLGGRSANRGRCAGTCRLEYKCKDKKGHLLSLRDLETIEDVCKIVDAGVFSLKIEGRMKKPEYIAGVTSIYKKYLDEYKTKNNVLVSKRDKNILKNLYSRGGHSTSYLYKHNGKEFITIDNAGYNSNNDDEFNRVSKLYVDVFKKKEIQGEIKLKIGQEILLTICCNENKFYFKSPYKCEFALKNKTTDKDIYKIITSTGTTNFMFTDLKVDIDDNIFVPHKFLKEIRRNALQKLQESLDKEYIKNNRKESIITNDSYRSFIENLHENNNDKLIQTNDKLIQTNDNQIKINELSNEINYFVGIEKSSQFEPLLAFEQITSLNVSFNIYLNEKNKFEEILKKWKSKDKRKLFISLPYILRQNTINSFKKLIKELSAYNIDGFLCRDISEKLIGEKYLNEINTRSSQEGALKKCEWHADGTIYAFNKISSRFLTDIQGFNKVLVSYEIHKKDISALNTNNCKLLIYGKAPLMVSANCLQKTVKQCDHKNNIINLTDRKGVSFAVHKNCDFCYNTIYNSYPQCLFNLKEDIKTLKLSELGFDFVDEDTDSVSNVLETYFSNKQMSFDFTYGHFKKGIL